MVSRWRRLALGSGLLLFMGVAYSVGHVSGGRSGKLQLSVVDQHIQGESLVISVLTSNAGSAVLVNGGNCEIRYELDGAWTTNSYPGLHSSIFWLLPGEIYSQRVRLPWCVSRFQVGAWYEVAHGRIAVACRLHSSQLPHWVSDPLGRIVGLLPYHPGPYVEVWDGEHEVRIAEMHIAALGGGWSNEVVVVSNAATNRLLNQPSTKPSIVGLVESNGLYSIDIETGPPAEAGPPGSSKVEKPQEIVLASENRPIDMASMLLIYAEVTGADLDIGEGVRQVPGFLSLPSTPSMTRVQVIDLLDDFLLKAGVIVTHSDAKHAVFRLKKL